MKALIVSSLILLMASDLYGQSGSLVMKNIVNGRMKSVRVGKTITITTHDNRKSRGRMTIVGDSGIVLKADTIFLSDIKTIRTKSVPSKIVGSIFTISGGFATAGGSAILITGLPEGGFGALFAVIIGLPITTVGVIFTSAGILTFTVGKKFESKRWSYSIERGI